MADSAPATPAPAGQPPAPNAAVRDILRQAGGPAATTPITPISSAPSAAGGRPLSDHPDAVRARRRRQAAQAARAGGDGQNVHQSTQAARASFVRPRAGAGPQFTPDQLRAQIAALPAAPPAPASAEQLEKATKNIAMIIRGAGWLAATIFKREYMRVPDADARDTAGAILEGYPELANESDADYRKILAWAAVGGLAFERYSRYQRDRGAPVAPVAASSPPPSSSSSSSELPAALAMMPVNM